MKKIILLFFSFLISMMFSLASFAENFIITNYDVLLDVKTNKDIHVTEHIDVFFTRSSHGIFRDIPISGKLYYENGKTSPLKAKISDVNVNHMFSVSPNGSNTRIKIGNPNRTVSGVQKYVIKYVYSMGPDKLKDNDELYFNLIGQQWGTNIQNVDFKVVLPVPYEKLREQTGFSIGRRGVSGYNPNHLMFSIKDNKEIVGKVNKTLLPYEGVTIRTTLPDGYFEKSTQLDDEILVLIIMPLLAFIAFLMWYIWGRDDKVIPIVNFYPPKNRNSAEVGVEYSGMVTDKEISSLILYLANKGYLEIEDDGISYTLNKIKDYDGKNPYEKRLMLALFGKVNSITIEELQCSSSFYMSCNTIKHSLNKIKDNIFDKTANSFEKVLILVVCIIGLLLSMVYVLGNYSFDLFYSEVAPVLIFPIVGIIAVSLVVYNIVTSSMPISAKIFQGLFITIWGSGFIGVPLFIFILPNCSFSIDMLPALLLGLACLISSLICLLNMPKRNKKGRLALGHILGFKQFLEVAEKHRLEALLAEDRNYASDILPYAYVLDVSDKIMPVLETLSLYTQPTWYKGNMTSDSFSRFGTAILSASMPSVSNGGISHSSGGSGFSGGGCSGGGGGGGGGGSW